MRCVEVVEGLERLFQLFRVAGMFLMVDGVQLCDISLYAPSVSFLGWVVGVAVLLGCCQPGCPYDQCLANHGRIASVARITRWRSPGVANAVVKGLPFGPGLEMQLAAVRH